jgi:hypothetical protein
MLQSKFHALPIYLDFVNPLFFTDSEKRKLRCPLEKGHLFGSWILRVGNRNNSAFFSSSVYSGDAINNRAKLVCIRIDELRASI